MSKVIRFQGLSEVRVLDRPSSGNRHVGQAAGMTDAAWIMEALLRYGVPQDFTLGSLSERATSLRRPFIHAIEGHHHRLALTRPANPVAR